MAGRAQYRFDQWTADNGLPQNSVYGILQTRDGYLWLATVDGLARFDGVRFTIFNKSNSPGIISNRFLSLFEDAEGSIWAATETNYSTRYDRGRFSSYPVELALEAAFPNWISEDDEGNPITITSDLRTTHLRDGRFRLYEPPIYTPETVPVKSQNKVVWCQQDGPNRRLRCLLSGRLLELSQADGLPGIQAIDSLGIEDREGNLWFAFAEPEPQLLRIGRDRVARSFTRQDGLHGVPLFFVPGRERVSLISRDAEGTVWITDLGSMRSEVVTRQWPEWFQNTIGAYEDHEGSIWIGTLRGGLFRLRKQFITSYSKAEGLAENNAYPIYEDHTGTIWVGTSGGLFRYHENGTFELVKGSDSFNVYALGETADGRLLASYYGETFVLEQDRLKRFYANPNGVTHTIYTHTDGSIWFGGVGGLARVENEKVEMFSELNGLAANDVKVIINDREGGMWVGSYGGLTHYKDGQFTKWTEAEGLPTPTIRALYLDAEGSLWIGSYDSGLARFKDGKFTHYTTKHGLFNDGAFQILEDERRNFWIGSNRGIYRLHKDELNEFAEGRRTSITSIAYGKSDGMLNVECNGGRSPGGVKSRDGRLWFPTQDGVAVIDPETVPVNTQPPPVMIESVKIDDREVFGAGAAETTQAADQFRIRLEPHQRNFEIQYTGLSFINSENLRFRYKLDGLDADWVDAGTRRTAYFSNVPPGDYTFRVVAANADGVWNETGAAVPLMVLPPFYRTWWFMTLATLAAAASVMLIYWWRVSELKRKHALQAAFSRRLIDSQEQERKRFAAELHDGLGQSLVIVKNLAGLSLKRSGDKETVREHLQKISSTASQAIEETREMAFNLRPHLLDRLGLTRTIESMLDKVFSAGGVRFETLLDPIDDVFPAESEILFYRIVQECASNIVKHAGASEARVAIKRGDGALRLTVSDNGIGFDPSTIGKNVGKLSFGLVGISERTRLLSGKMNIDSGEGKGTTVEINFDL